MNVVYRNMISLLRAALHNEAPVLSCSDSRDWELLLEACERHVVTVLAREGLRRCAEQPDEAILQKWNVAKEKAIYHAVALEAERSYLFDALKQNEIEYLPLKGSVLKGLYPCFGMRQMVDVDVWVFDEKRSAVRDIVTERGYDTVRYGAGHHDVYQKMPVCFEIHGSLFDNGEAPRFFEYFKSLKLQAVDEYERRLSDEDFYLYLIAHLYHHFYQAGVGIRSLLDCFVFLRCKGKTMDLRYLSNELRKLDLTDFEQEIRSLAFKLFDVRPNPLTDREEELLDLFGRAGAVGSVEVMVKQRVDRLRKANKDSKWSYYKSRLFLSYEWFEDHLPFYARHRWLIPAYYVFRFFRAILFRRKSLKTELEALKKESI